MCDTHNMTQSSSPLMTADNRSSGNCVLGVQHPLVGIAMHTVTQSPLLPSSVDAVTPFTQEVIAGNTAEAPRVSSS